jgi:transposase
MKSTFDGEIHQREECNMKLLNSDKEILREFGHDDKDIEQIERATGKTVYKINYKDKISTKHAIELLGRETFLSGISRSAFHYSALRNIENSKNVISFDSSKLFE